MSAPADVAHCESMPCGTGLLLNAIATLTGGTTLLPCQFTSPAAGGWSQRQPPNAPRARPSRALRERHNTHHERNQA